MIYPDSPKPNELCINYVLSSLSKFFPKNIFPDRISLTMDGGINITFHQKNESFELEFFNDGDIVFLHTINREIEDIIDISYKQLDEKINLIIGKIS